MTEKRGESMNLFELYKIINEEFYCKENTKLKIQKELKTNDILVPNIIEYEKVTKYEYPLFFKSVDHAELVLKVYNKNFIADFLALPSPHKLIRKYIGTNSNSQNIKNSNISQDAKTPNIAVSNMNINA